MIGTVEKVANEDTGLLKYAVIKAAVDFSNLEEVMVITNSAPGMDATPTSVVQRLQKEAADAAAKAARDAQLAQEQQRQQQAQQQAQQRGVVAQPPQAVVQQPAAQPAPVATNPAANSGVAR